MVFPQPVSPVTSTTLEDLPDSSSFDKKSSLAVQAGSVFRCLSIDLLQQKGVAGGVFVGGVDQNALLVLGRFFIDDFLDADFVDADDEVDGAVDIDDDDDALPIGFGTDVDDNGKRGKSSRLCNIFCSSP